MTLRFDTRLFTLAKDPEQPGAYQDACCLDTEHHMAAIADGVSSALFSGPWAAILAEAVVADCPNPCDPEEFGAWLRRQRKRWAASIDTSSLAWFQKAKLPMGAFSTLLYARVCEVDDARRGPSAAIASWPSPWATVASSRSAAANWCARFRWRLPTSSRPIRSSWAASI